jgi:penicillin-insensitive murein endopeptidase
MLSLIRAALVTFVAVATTVAALAQDNTPAKVLFGRMAQPADLQSRSIGSYARGCLAGADPLPLDGPAWQVMRLSRNRMWGMPVLVNFIEKFATDAQTLDGWPGLLIGDMSQPRGGPMVTGHASHQIGLDVDIWFDPMPPYTMTREEREQTSATSYIKKGTNTELRKDLWTDAHTRLIKRAASYPEVERIFVNAGVKKELCATAGRDRAWLRKVRPWYLHDDHLHVRLSCPPGIAGCVAQDPVPEGDGCGENLRWWLSSVPYRPADKPAKPSKPPPPMTLAALPNACREVLAAPAPGGGPLEINIPNPPPRPMVN